MKGSGRFTFPGHWPTYRSLSVPASPELPPACSPSTRDPSGWFATALAEHDCCNSQPPLKLLRRFSERLMRTGLPSDRSTAVSHQFGRFMSCNLAAERQAFLHFDASFLLRSEEHTSE